MGTTLTGTTPQDTYDSLIKVTDNGPLSGTAKYLSDGLGNDSALALSTSRVGIGTATPSFETEILLAANPRLGITATNSTGVPELYLRRNATTIVGYLGAGVNSDLSNVGDFVVLENRLSTGGVGIRSNGATGLILTSAGNVGIGTSSPDTKLQVAGTGATGLSIRANTSGDAFMRYYLDGVIASDAYVDRATGVLNIRSNQNSSAIAFSTSAALIERVRITDNGLTFNGDTAAANALDDYEEGEWTMGISFGGNSVGAAYILNTGRYTKIGRQVTASGYLAMSAKGSSTGDAAITGLPFTSGNTYKAITSASLRLDSVSFANAFQAYVDGPSTAISLGEITEAGVASNLTNADFSDSSAVMVSVTYTV